MDAPRASRTLIILAFLAPSMLGCAVALPPALSDLELSATQTALAPTPPPAPPAPTGLQAKRGCRGDFRGGTLIWVEDVDLSWQDNAAQETGYRVYQNRIPQDSLPPDSTKYHLQFRYNQGVVIRQLDTFAVEAVRDGSASPRLAVDVPRCP